jgi:hypothetical protein
MFSNNVNDHLCPACNRSLKRLWLKKCCFPDHDDDDDDDDDDDNDILDP